eukprot:CAMPEP_0197317132 /NCGR_PEP_ID=MMETSP0891-20130614/45814_1 /TAXON_ID=44058 ORGANISM="Aureoumbra lagunensis, Strain CCMP1510" /NCGR_SAMPLE_ID=MMETSP0891 /ASSEMBLY_ACC=CAM_ASM_000534 /LENGTH=134 /DNA_ID=CAMNT_0042806973 /DNA_START=155 /DNA_END=559 /DNA_ORIENTATION=+
MGYSLNLLLLELEAIDEERSLTLSERERRRQWLKAVRYTLDILTNCNHHLYDVQDAELAGLVHSVVETQTLADRGVQLHHALQLTDHAHCLSSSPSMHHYYRDESIVSLPHLILLTMKHTWELQADESYPGATG